MADARSAIPDGAAMYDDRRPKPSNLVRIFNLKTFCTKKRVS